MIVPINTKTNERKELCAQSTGAESSHVELVDATLALIRNPNPNAPPDARYIGHMYTATLRCRHCGLMWTHRSESMVVPSHCCLVAQERARDTL